MSHHVPDLCHNEENRNTVSLQISSQRLEGIKHGGKNTYVGTGTSIHETMIYLYLIFFDFLQDMHEDRTSYESIIMYRDSFRFQKVFINILG